MKHLPKHLRPRWRYLGVGLEAWPDDAVDRSEFQRAVWAAARDLYGDAGSAALDLTVLRCSCADGSGSAVVRTHRGEVDRARAVLACLERVADHPVGVRVRGVSGTVRACEEKYIRREGEPTRQRRVAFEDAERRAVVRGRRADVRVDDGFAGATELDL
ncbi:MAG: Rpp14/Pop5 family protein [Haloarculaceae archaeon]